MRDCLILKSAICGLLHGSFRPSASWQQPAQPQSQAGSSQEGPQATDVDTVVHRIPPGRRSSKAAKAQQSPDQASDAAARK